MALDTSELFSGNTWGDIFCYNATVTDTWTYVFMLISIFIIIVAYGFNRQYEKDLVFLTASIVNFMGSVVLLLGGIQNNCVLIKETTFIISTILLVAGVLLYLYNNPEGA